MNKRYKIECGICTEPFGSTSAHNPMCLPQCGHSFCRKFIAKMQNSVCPNCRIEIGQRKIPINKEVVDMISDDDDDDECTEEMLALIDAIVTGDSQVVYEKTRDVLLSSGDAYALSKLALRDENCRMEAMESLSALYDQDAEAVLMCPLFGDVIDALVKSDTLAERTSCMRLLSKMWGDESFVRSKAAKGVGSESMVDAVIENLDKYRSNVDLVRESLRLAILLRDDASASTRFTAVVDRSVVFAFDQPGRDGELDSLANTFLSIFRHDD